MRATEFITESKIIDYAGIKLNVSIDGANADIRALRPDGQQMGYVVFDRDGQTLTPDDLAVDEKYQGQGVAKIMYDYVKSLGFRIEASYDQTEAGKGFWQKHRGEERVWEDTNRTIDYHGVKLKFEEDVQPTFKEAKLTAYTPTGELMGYMELQTMSDEEHEAWIVHNVSIKPQYQRKGLGRLMYDYLAREHGYEIHRSPDQSTNGAAFWDKHRGEERVWENEEVLDELFQPGKDYKWSFTGSEEAIAVFYVNKVPYQFHAYTHPGDDGMWEIEFKNAERGLGRTTKFGLTGTGNSAEVMATIVDIMREFLQRYQGSVTSLTFTADEASRQSLYARIAKRLLPDWQLTKQDKHFVLSAPKPIDEEVLDEMPLPTNWDPQQFKQQGTSYKSRLAYALERAKKLGAGSSRVAMTIEYEGRPTVLKVAKNQKGLAQNSVEADILSDGYASQIGILIPIIDYDEQNREPSWVHTEIATKANEQQLCRIMRCKSLNSLISFGEIIAGKYPRRTAQDVINGMVNDGVSEQDIETCTDYANKLADLANSFDVELRDLTRAANWGLYQGHPVIIDVGFNSNVLNQYYSR